MNLGSNPPAFPRIGLALLVAVLLLFGFFQVRNRATAAPPIRIGVLHSLSGTMAASERPLVDAVRLVGADLILGLHDTLDRPEVQAARLVEGFPPGARVVEAVAAEERRFRRNDAQRVRRKRMLRNQGLW